MQSVNNTLISATIFFLENPVAVQSETSSGTTAYTQNEHNNPMPSASTNIPLSARKIKEDLTFNKKYKDLLECLSKGKNLEINALLVNHVKEIDNLMQNNKVFFSSAHQQFILSLSNNIPEDLQNEDLNICIDNINTLLNKVLFFIQTLVKVKNNNNDKVKQAVHTDTATQPMWLFQEKKIINAKSLTDLSEKQIIQIANKPDIDNIITKKFIGQGFNNIISIIEGKNSKDNKEATRKRKLLTFDDYPDLTTSKKIKSNREKFRKLDEKKKNKFLLDDHIEKIDNFCKDKGISLLKTYREFISYLNSPNHKVLFDDKGNYLLDKLLNKIYFIITELNKYNTVESILPFIYPIFHVNPSNIKSILDIPDELIKDPSFNQSLFNLLKMQYNAKHLSVGYPSVSEVLAAQTST